MSYEHYKSYHPEEETRPPKKTQTKSIKKANHKHQYEDVWLQSVRTNVVTIHLEPYYMPGKRCIICNKLAYSWAYQKFDAQHFFNALNQQINSNIPIIFVENMWDLPKGD